jgi:predicted DNA-binding protein
MRQQYKITLGDDLRARLDRAGKHSGRPVSDEIRARLEQSLDDDDLSDEQSGELAAVILKAAREVSLDVGAPWHADAGAYRTFRRVITTALAKWRPAGIPDSTLENVELTPFQGRPHASYPTNDTDDLGVWIAHDVLENPDNVERARIRASREKTLKEIVKLQQERGSDND